MRNRGRIRLAVLMSVMLTAVSVPVYAEEIETEETVPAVFSASAEKPGDDALQAGETEEEVTAPGGMEPEVSGLEGMEPEVSGPEEAEPEASDPGEFGTEGAVTGESVTGEAVYGEKTEVEKEEPEDKEDSSEAADAEADEELLQQAYADVVYRTHCQTYGWFPWVSNGGEAGITGQAKRMEAMNILLENANVSGSIEYRTHCQTYGWLDWVRDGAQTGTTGEAKRLEAIQIRLTGEMAENFDVYYRVHCQTFGWMGWAKNGAPSGSAGYAKRLEAIEIRLVKKGGPAPGSTDNAYASADGQAAGTQSGSGNSLIEYCTHVQTYGWQKYVRDGQMSGTSGESKRLEGIRIRLTGQKYSGGVRYRTHVQTYGWQDYVQDGAMSGTEGQSKRLEAIQISLTGEMADRYDIYYCVHCQTFGWMGWAKNGAPAGTAGYAKRLEGIRIRLVEKGGAAPGSTADAYRQYTAPQPVAAQTAAADNTVMNEANWQVLINTIGAVESGGQIYGNRNYAAYAGQYAASPYEYTCTLGWAQFYGVKAQRLVQNIFQASPFAFRSIDTNGLIEKRLGGDWVSEMWDPSDAERSTLIRLITSDIGKKQQDLLFRADMAPIVSYCEQTFTQNAKAVIMYAEIAHLGGQAAANRIFQRCMGSYSTNRILASLRQDQNDYSNNQQVGDSMYDLRHAKCAEFVERYVQ